MAAMPSIGHVAVGLATARIEKTPQALGMNAWRVILVLLSVLPDVDVVAFALGIPYSAPTGHRGAVHSLTVAGLCGLACGVAARAGGVGALRFGIVGGLVMASHGLLDGAALECSAREADRFPRSHADGLLGGVRSTTLDAKGSAPHSRSLRAPSR
jgi:hypothetical protein